MKKKNLFAFIICGLIFLTSIKVFSSAESEVGKEVVTGAVVGGATGMIAKQAAGGMGESIGKFLNSPTGIAILSGISLGMNTVLYNAASEQEVECKNNADKIQKMIDVYKANMSNMCVNGREKLEEPQCYCYLENGKKNPNRTNSDVCKKQWSQDDFKFNTQKGDYSKAKAISELTGCMTVNGKFDEKCSCKKLVNGKGENACMKASQLALTIPGAMGGFAKSTGLSEVLGIAANAANGNGDLSKFNGGRLALNAARAKNAALELVNANANKIQKGDLLKGLLTDPDRALNASSQMLGGEANVARFAGSSPLSMVGTPEGGLLESVNKAEKDLKKNGVEFFDGKGLAEKRAKKDSGFKFAFNDGASGSNVLNLPDSGPEKKYKITGDINSNEDVSIFDILSNRYMQSGLRRLMDEEN